MEDKTEILRNIMKYHKLMVHASTIEDVRETGRLHQEWSQKLRDLNNKEKEERQKDWDKQISADLAHIMWQLKASMSNLRHFEFESLGKPLDDRLYESAEYIINFLEGHKYDK